MTKTCVYCGTSFVRAPRTAHSQWEGRRFCSQRCGMLYIGEMKRSARAAIEKDGLRTCSHCGERKPLGEFRNPRGRTIVTQCSQCVLELNRKERMLRVYGLTIEDDDAITTHQGNVCAICGRPPSKTRLHTDHAHDSGLVRGKVCWTCNRLLGIVHDDPERLRRAAAYLEDPPAIRALGREVYGRKGRTTNKAKKRRKKKIE